VGQYRPNFRVEGDIPVNRIYRDMQANECLTTSSLTVFRQRNLVPDFLQAKCDVIHLLGKELRGNARYSS